MLVNKFMFKSCLSYVHKTNFATLSEQAATPLKEKERDARHYAPANKEWKNSVYTYNKGNLLNIAAKDQKVASVIKSYFNLVPKPIKITKSKRMRDLLRRSSTRQLFVSKPEIKQNNDKAIITVYTHDREKVSYLKKLFFLNRWLNSKFSNLHHLPIKKYRSNRFIISKYSLNYLFSKHVFNKCRRIKYRLSRNILKRSSAKYNIKRKFFQNTVKSLLSKRQFIVNTLFYHFLRWALSLFRIKINLKSRVITVKMSKKRIKQKKNKKENYIERINVIDLMLFTIEKGKKKSKDIITGKKKIKIKGVLNIKTLRTINTLLLQYLIVNANSILSVKQVSSAFKIYPLFNLFRTKYFNAIARKHLKKEVLIIKHLSKLYLNKFKFNSYIPGLKGLLTNIYEKKIQLNIINLKYLHLNSDLFTEAISIKLRTRTTNLLKVLRKSFKLVKTYKANNMFLFSEKEKNFVVNDIKTYFGKYNVINGNVLNVVFKEMFKNRNVVASPNRHKKPNSNVVDKNAKGLNTNIKDTLTSLKYKWITGLRVEAKGRLTKRYAAARAVFKYKYKGTLKNLEHLKNIENKLQSPSLFLLRSDVRPNTQYSFVPSKRRIGAFGIKSWISNS